MQHSAPWKTVKPSGVPALPFEKNNFGGRVDFDEEGVKEKLTKKLKIKNNNETSEN